MSSLQFWLWLSSKREISQKLENDLLEAFGSPEALYYAKEADIKSALEMGSYSRLTDSALFALMDKNLDYGLRIIDHCNNESIRLITIQDADYPDRLKNIYEPPRVLYIKGTLPEIDDEAAIGFVGTRKPSAYGADCALRMSYALAKAGILIVSGGALGIDRCAHEGALRAQKPTVAVLGCGVDVAYPADNKQLLEDIASYGAVISEYEPWATPTKESFPRRNRIISGLSVGVLVVEAPRHSGALITASCALEQGRDVYAVPGSIATPDFVGSHQLIKSGAALVSEPLDILMEYVAHYPHRITLDGKPVPESLQPTEKPSQKTSSAKKTEKAEAKKIDLSKVIANYTAQQQAILRAVNGRPMLTDEIMEATGMTMSAALSEITLLEIDGILSRTPEGRFTLD